MVLLKGSAYAAAGLRLRAGRLFGDVDILVPEEALGEVEGGADAARLGDAAP